MEQVERAARRWRLLVAAAALGWSVSPQAAETQCPEQFWKRAPPQLLNSKLASETRQICYHGYAVLHSGLTRTPLWSAEHLTRERIEAAHGLVRENLFHPDPNLPPRERAELSDYARSGFDRGHMAPSGDMPTSLSQDESFSFANMIPQNPDNNRHLWSELEGSVRDLTEHERTLRHHRPDLRRRCAAEPQRPRARAHSDL